MRAEEDAVAKDLRVENLSSGVLAEINMTVKAGDCFAVIGASGAGKSTLLRSMADLVPHTGDVWLGTQAQSSLPAPLWRQKVCYVPSDSGWWAPRVRDHFPVTVSSLKRELALFGLDENLFDSVPERLSTGERQRLSLLRALSQNPYALLLDEPTSALDHDTTRMIESYLLEWLKRGHLLVIASHDTQQVERLADNTLVLEKRS